MWLIKKTALLAVTSVMIVSLTGISQASAKCYSWDTARSVIKENGLVAAGQVRRHLSGGRVIEFRLCKVRGRYVYRVVTLRPGRVNKMVIDATSGNTISRSNGRNTLPADAGVSIKRTYRILKKRFRQGGY